MMIKYPLRRSILPTADTILPYLTEIDQRQWYSNFGKSLIEFELKLANIFSVEPNQLACTSNGTAALTLSLLASELKPSSYCLLPSFTFIASAAAVVAAGLKPWFIDINLDTWSITPEQVYPLLKKHPNKISSVMVVSPYGQPVDTYSWISFSNETGIPVVIDGAWCFDSVKASHLPFMVSLHATKVFGIGEGGVVICKNLALISVLKQASNFGMNQNKLATIPSPNYKMSEYQAAVGLASLKEWPATKANAKELAKYYISALAEVEGIQLLPGFTAEWAPASIALKFDTPITKMRGKLLEKGIEARSWWGAPCHQHPAYQNYPREKLSNTNRLVQSLLNLPFSTDMTKSDVDYICETLVKIYHPYT